jgi:MFS family permease
VGALLSHRSFRSLWFAGLISDAGDWLLLIALPIVVFDVTGSALGTSVAFLIELAPGIVLAPVAGRLVDRLDRRRLLLVLTGLQALALLPLLTVGGRGGLPVVYSVILVQAALAALFDPAKNALLPTLVPPRDLVSANSLVGLSQNLARLVGGPLGGLLLAVSGLRMIVLVDAISYLIAGVLIARLGRDRSGAPERPAAADRPGPAARSGTLALLRRRQIRAVAGVAFVDQIAQGMFVVSFIIFVAQRLHGGSGEIGLLRGIQAVGAIAGGIVLSWRGGRVSPARLTAWSSAAFGVIELVLWNAPRISTAAPIYWILFTLVGAPGVLLLTGMVSHTQLAAAEHERGRAFALLGLAGNAGQMAGILAAGLITGLLGLSTVLDAQALLYLAGGALAARLMTEARIPVGDSGRDRDVPGLPGDAIMPRAHRREGPRANPPPGATWV